MRIAMPSRPDIRSDPSATTAPSPTLVAALRRVLRPLVRLMVARGITYPHLSDLLNNRFDGNPIVTRDHCYACTAGQGSSCSGALG